MHPALRNRIIDHVTVRAGDLVPHPLNFRRHPDDQREALAASLQEVGFARSLLGYRLPDGRIQLIDGHLRAEYDPDAQVTVEVLDVSEDEARKLLLTLDPLAALADIDAQAAAELARLVETDSEALADLWDSLAANDKAAEEALARHDEPAPAEQFLILITCTSEEQQTELLAKFQEQGLTCKALLQ
jgi:ParB-like chromosome segregation protein Spo0J